MDIEIASLIRQQGELAIGPSKKGQGFQTGTLQITMIQSCRKRPWMKIESGHTEPPKGTGGQ